MNDREMFCSKCPGKIKKRDGKADDMRRQRYRCVNGHRITTPLSQPITDASAPDFSAQNRAVRKAVRAAGVKRFVITSAQNATPVNRAFLNSLLHYCNHNDATLIVIPYRYRNVTSVWSEHAERDDWWASEIVPYLSDQRVDLNKNLVLLADIKTQPTAVSPLSGFETLTGGKSAIIGHPKLELVTIPTPQHSLPKILTTTGAVTLDNYTPTKAGKKGEHHHTYGAAVVEIVGSKFHLRQINAVRDGSFIDLTTEYRPDGVLDAGRAAAVILGDLHCRFVDPGVVKATFDAKDSIVRTLKPEHIVYHDIMDFHSQNHHHQGKVFINLAKYQARKHNVEAEIDEVAEFVGKRAGDAKVIFVPSNHPDALARWIEEANWKSDPENAEFYLETALQMVKAARMTDSGTETLDPFAHWMRRKLGSNDRYVFLRRDQSFAIAGIEVGYHGDRGPNGARGNIGGFGKIGAKTVIGHSHTPGIKDGVYQVGTSSRLRLEYNSGPSSWLHTHAVVYANGKRSLISVIGGEWRA